jgi:hypothetical protein
MSFKHILYLNKCKLFFGLHHPRFFKNVYRVNVAIMKRRNLLKLISNIEEYKKNPRYNTCCNKQIIELILEVLLRSGGHQSKSRSLEGFSFCTSKYSFSQSSLESLQLENNSVGGRPKRCLGRKGKVSFF